jgi:hypothetical protein
MNNMVALEIFLFALPLTGDYETPVFFEILTEGDRYSITLQRI